MLRITAFICDRGSSGFGPAVAQRGQGDQRTVGDEIGGRPRSRRAANRVWAKRESIGGVLGATLGAGCLGWMLGAAPELEAGAGSLGVDLDGDGLTDVQEVVLGSNVNQADSDGDGLRDLEEVARQLDPLVPDWVVPEELSVGFAVSTSGGLFHLTTAIYLPDGNPSPVDLELGVYFQGNLIPLPPGAFLPISTGYAESGSALTSGVLSLSTPIPDFLLQSVGSVGFYATAAPAHGAPVTTATVVNLTSTAGVTALRTAVSGPTGGGVLLTPIAPPGDLPVSFTSNEVCFQTTQLMGVEDGVQLMQVIDSGCVPSVGACTPACGASVGSTFLMLDPLALIGG